MSNFFKKVGQLFSVPSENYELDIEDSGQGLGFTDPSNELYQMDWSTLQFAKLLSHQCIYAKYIDNELGVLVNINSEMIPFLELFDAMMDAREEFQHGTPEIHKRLYRDRFHAPTTPEGLMTLSIKQKQEIEEQVEIWDPDQYHGDEGDFGDLATEFVERLEYDEECEDERTQAHKKNDDVFTGETDEETGPKEENTMPGDLASIHSPDDIEEEAKYVAEVVEKSEYVAPDTIPDTPILDNRRRLEDSSGDNNILLGTYVHASISEYDIYCIFSSMELSEALFMATLESWLSGHGSEFVDYPMEKFHEHLNEVFPVMDPDRIPMGEDDFEPDKLERDKALMTGTISDGIIPPRGTRMALFRDREASRKSTENGLGTYSFSEPDTSEMSSLRQLLGFDPTMYYMKRMSDEYKLRASPLVQIVTLMDSILNGASSIIDEAYAKHATAHAHISAPSSKGGIVMPTKVEVEWVKLEHIDNLINEWRRWTKQVTKASTMVDK